MKEKTKDRLVSGTAGIAAGAAGALGGEELMRQLKEDGEQPQDDNSNNNSGRTEVPEKEEVNNEPSHNDHPAQDISHEELTEITPVDSGGNHEYDSNHDQTSDDSDILIAEADPDDIAVDIVTGGGDQEDLLADNRTETDNDIITDIESIFSEGDEADIIETGFTDVASNELDEDIDINEDDIDEDDTDDTYDLADNEDDNDSLMIDDIG